MECARVVKGGEVAQIPQTPILGHLRNGENGGNGGGLSVAPGWTLERCTWLDRYC